MISSSDVTSLRRSFLRAGEEAGESVGGCEMKYGNYYQFDKFMWTDVK